MPMITVKDMLDPEGTQRLDDRTGGHRSSRPWSSWPRRGWAPSSSSTRATRSSASCPSGTTPERSF
ncbi:MAG: hypothetical protein MZV63_63235 [Marinilabiliales bacterium]|nr:hypothetical protein [Marinilabiliales bacterium]